MLNTIGLESLRLARCHQVLRRYQHGVAICKEMSSVIKSAANKLLPYLGVKVRTGTGGDYNYSLFLIIAAEVIPDTVVRRGEAIVLDNRWQGVTETGMRVIVVQETGTAVFSIACYPPAVVMHFSGYVIPVVDVTKVSPVQSSAVSNHIILRDREPYTTEDTARSPEAVLAAEISMRVSTCKELSMTVGTACTTSRTSEVLAELAVAAVAAIAVGRVLGTNALAKDFALRKMAREFSQYGDIDKLIHCLGGMEAICSRSGDFASFGERGDYTSRHHDR